MPAELPSGIKVNELFQAGIVVKDVEASMKLYRDLLGIDEWAVITIDHNLCSLTYRGKPSQHSFRAAMATVGPLMIELLQPLEGQGTYSEFLEKYGEGVHHLGHVIVPDLDGTLDKLTKAGFVVVETGEPAGSGGDHKWAYVDTTPALGYILEFSQGADPRQSLPHLPKKTW